MENNIKDYELHEKKDVPPKQYKEPITSQIDDNTPDKGQSNDSLESHSDHQTATEQATTDKQNKQHIAMNANSSQQTDTPEPMEVEHSGKQHDSLQEKPVQPQKPITSQIDVDQLQKGQNNNSATEDTTTDERNNQANAINAYTPRQTGQNESMEVDHSIHHESLEGRQEIHNLEKHVVATQQRPENGSEQHTISTLEMLETQTKVEQHNSTTETKIDGPTGATRDETRNRQCNEKPFKAANVSNHIDNYSANENEEHQRMSSCVQKQAQIQRQRSLEASKQMLYGTFANVIGILEELEKREIAQSNFQPEMPKSHIPLPNQDHKSFEDIESIVKTQILLFETQTRYCPQEVLGQVKEELIRLTICWTAVRAERGVSNNNKTDAYVGKLLEVLVYGNTKHNVPDSSGVSEQVMRDSFMAILQGVHTKNVLDDEFKNDRSRTATAPNIRESSLFREGATRIAIARGLAQLDPALESIVSTLESANLK